MFELVAFVYMKNCTGKKICMHSVFKLEIQAVQSLHYYPNTKQERKIPHQKISTLLSYFHFMSTGSSYTLLKERTLLAVTIKVCFVFFITNTENNSEWRRRHFYWFILKKERKKKQTDFVSCTLLQPQNHCMLQLNDISYLFYHLPFQAGQHFAVFQTHLLPLSPR